METNVFRGSPHIFRNCSEDDIICDFEDQTIENNLIIRSNDLFSDFPSLDSHNSSMVYESIESIEMIDNKENKDFLNTSNTSTQSRKEDLFCVNNCKQIIDRLVADNEELKKLKKQLIVIEELNVELIKDKQRLESVLKETKDLLEKKMVSKNQLIEDLKKSYYICESFNSSLQKELELKKNQISKLENHVKEIEDKLYYSEMQLSESQKSEEQLMMSYKNAKHAFTEEEKNKYKTIEQLHSVYVECAQQQNQIEELKQQVSHLNREIADKDNELWFYKLKVEDCLHSCGQNIRHSLDSQRESIYVNKTASDIPEYSFSVNEDESEHIYSDFNDVNQLKSWDQCSEYESLSNISEPSPEPEVVSQTEAEATEEKRIENILFVHFLMLFIVKIPIKTILFIVVITLSTKILFGSVLETRLPAYTSWEEIIYRMLSPYLTKVKVSKTQ